MKYLFDTNICIYIINNRYHELLSRIENTGLENICISSLTIAEMEFGIAKSKKRDENRRALMEFLLPFKIIDFTQKDAFKYGINRQSLQREGQIIGNMDLLIGAQAISRNLILVTNNVKEFERLENIEIENWI